TSSQFDYGTIQSGEASFAHFYSSNVSLKTELFRDAGGFDEDFVYYYEDLDFGWRLHEAGMRLVYERGAIAQHFHPMGWADLVRRFDGVARGEYLMAKKHAWFSPFFADRISGAVARPRRSPIWPKLARVMPSRPSRVSAAVWRRANDAYLKRI